jgi:hypothetical protein
MIEGFLLIVKIIWINFKFVSLIYIFSLGMICIVLVPEKNKLQNYFLIHY